MLTNNILLCILTTRALCLACRILRAAHACLADKNALLKRARDEADKEIAAIRAQREAQFQDYVKSVR